MRSRGLQRSGHDEPAVDAEPRTAPTPAPHALTPATIRALQRSAGNAAVGRLLARKPEIEPTDAEMGQRVVDQLVHANRNRTSDVGVHYAHNYQRAASSGTDPFAKALWREDYWNGYANPVYFERIGMMEWRLRPGVDAAPAIKAWLAGPTIAECASVLVAIELDTIRAAVGDERFNAMFGKTGKQPERELLHITWFMHTSSAGAFRAETAEAWENVFDNEEPGKRSVKKGEWYYFYNHPKYLLKHPGGAFQGENSICMDDTKGAQKWSGFGVGIKTEPAMLDEMARAYNGPRTERDYEVLVRDWAPSDYAKKNPFVTWQSVYQDIYFTKVPPDYWDWGFPDQVTAKDIVDAPAHTIGNTKRKGGFQSRQGKKLDPNKVRLERAAPLVIL